MKNCIFGLLFVGFIFIGLYFGFDCGYQQQVSKTESIIVNEVKSKEIKDNYKRNLLLATKYWQQTGMVNRIFYRVYGYWMSIKYKDETKINLQALLQDIEIVTDLLGKETVTEDNYLQIKKSQNLLAVCHNIVNYALQNKCLLSKARVKFTEKLFEAWKELAEERQHFIKGFAFYHPVMLVDEKIYRARGFDDKLLLTILHKYQKDNLFTYEFVLENNTDKLIKIN